MRFGITTKFLAERLLKYYRLSCWSLSCLQPLETILSAAVGGLVVVSAAVLRVYLGYAYVGNRLLTASLEYEETGWYSHHRSTQQITCKI